MEILSKKENLTPEQIIVLSSISTDNEAIKKLVESNESTNEIEKVIIENSLLTEQSHDDNPMMFKGSLNFLGFYSGVSNELIGRLLDDKNTYFKGVPLMVLESGGIGDIDTEVLIKFLSKNSCAYEKISKKHLEEVVKHIIKNGFTVEQAATIAQMIIDSSINEKVVDLFIKESKFISKLNTSMLCSLISKVTSNDENYSSELFSTIVKNTVKRIKNDTDKELLLETLLDLEEHALFLLNLVHNGLLDSHLLNHIFMTILRYDKKRKERLEILMNIISESKITDEHITSYTLLSGVMNKLLKGAAADDIIKEIGKRKNADCVCATVVNNYSLLGKSVFKITVRTKVINLIKAFAKAFHRNKVLDDLYDKFLTKIDFIISKVNDTDRKIFEDTKERINQSFNAYNIGKKKKSELIKEVNDLIVELDEIIKEINSAGSNTNNDPNSNTNNGPNVAFMYEAFEMEDEDRNDIEKLKAAYKKWAQKNHPDKFQDEEEKKRANEHFIVVNELYNSEIERLKGNN